MKDPVINKLILVGVMAAATLLTRFLPFLLFPAGKKTPDYINYLGTTLPYATIGLLMVYCLRGMEFSDASRWLPELLSVGAVGALHVWKRNSLLSIGAGTVLYMILVQAVF